MSFSDCESGRDEAGRERERTEQRWECERGTDTGCE
jgi:hypothetical protein